MPEAWETRENIGEEFGLELRAGPKGPMLVGYGLVYGAYSQDLGGFVEVVMPGSAARTIVEQDVRSLFNHEPNMLLGRRGSGTLRLASDDHGVRYEVDLPDTQIGRDVAAWTARGDLTGSSFSFKVASRGGQSWTKTARGYPVRQLHEYRMRDIGPVVFPAYEKTEVFLRSLTEVALRGLAETRSLAFEEVIAAATEERLGELLDDPDEPLDDLDEPARLGPVATLHRIKRRW